MTDLVVKSDAGELVCPSDVIAEQVGNEHRAVLQLIRNNANDFNEFGNIAFEMRNSTSGGGRPTEVALLNEQQATLLMTYLRNNDIVRKFKKRLVSNFYEMRQELSKRLPDASKLSRMDLITMAMEAEKERLQLAAKVEEDAPKVHFHDVVTRSEGLLTTAEAAKSIGTGRNRLMAFMRQSGWLRCNNEPYQDKIERGWLDVRISEFEKPTGDIGKQITPMVTSLGLTRLTDLYQQRIGEVA